MSFRSPTKTLAATVAVMHHRRSPVVLFQPPVRGHVMTDEECDSWAREIVEQLYVLREKGLFATPVERAPS